MGIRAFRENPGVLPRSETTSSALLTQSSRREEISSKGQGSCRDTEGGGGSVTPLLGWREGRRVGHWCVPILSSEHQRCLDPTLPNPTHPPCWQCSKYGACRMRQTKFHAMQHGACSRTRQTCTLCSRCHHGMKRWTLLRCMDETSTAAVHCCLVCKEGSRQDLLAVSGHRRF